MTHTISPSLLQFTDIYQPPDDPDNFWPWLITRTNLIRTIHPDHHVVELTVIDHTIRYGVLTESIN